MDKNGSSLSPHNGGIYRNLMMPGFTDAGAGTSYMPKQKVIPRRTEASSMAANISTGPESPNVVDTHALNDDDDDDDRCYDVGAHSEDTFSEAATEVHDNRTNNSTIHSTTHRDRYYNLKSSVIQDNRLSGKGNEDSAKIIPNKTSNNHSSDQPNQDSNCTGIEVEATFGFFPSTKPPPSPSIRGIGSASHTGECRVDSSEKFTRTPKNSTKITSASRSPCPQPISPPPVTRKQLVAAKRAPSTAAIMEDQTKLPSAASTKTTAKTPPTNVSDHTKTESEVVNGINKNINDQVGETVNGPLQSGSGGESQKYEHDTSAEQDRAKTAQHQRPSYGRPFEISKMMRREASNFSLAPETGAIVNFEKHRTKSKQEEEKEDRNESGNHTEDEKTTQQCKESQSNNNEMEQKPYGIDNGDNNPESSSYDKGISRRLDLKALQEIENLESQKTTTTLQYFGNTSRFGSGSKVKSGQVPEEEDEAVNKNKDTIDLDDEGSEELSTSSSIVSSTCSEFGTVIQMGDAAMAARIKEVEEMELAALATVPIEDSNDTQETKVSQLSSSSLRKHDASLDLPILELPSSGLIDTITTKTNNLKSGQHLNARKTQIFHSDAKTTVATANSTISPRKRNPTKSEMVSAAFRRIGPIQSLHNNTVRNSISAPTTPMRLPARKDVTQTIGVSIAGRESSPTRYETASDIAGNPKNRILSPRFTSFLRGRANAGATSSVEKTQSIHQGKTAINSTPLSPRMAISQTFQYAQKTSSQNNAMTEYPVDGYGYNTDLKKENDINERRLKLQEDLVIPPLGQRPTISRLAPRVLPLESSSTIPNRRTLRYSNSLDYSNSKRSPFRELPSYSTKRRHFVNHSFPAPTNEVVSMATPGAESTDISLRGHINSGFSLAKLSNKTLALNSTMELQQPQRVDIEREDALDILACLVEQGIADWNNSNTNQSSTIVNNRGDTNKVENSSNTDEDSTAQAMLTSPVSTSPSTSSDILRTEKEEKTEEGTCPLTSDAKLQVDLNDSNHDHHDSESALQDLIQDFKKWVEDHEDNTASSHDEKRNLCQRKIELLQDLVRSRVYAVEMKRASASASSWLKSIGRGQSTRKLDILGDNDRNGKDERSRNSTSKLGTNKSNSTNEMEILTMQATLRRSQSELTATKEINTMLNEELSKCRAEIGRMKSISRSDNLNKSIFDDSERSSDTSSSEARPKESSADTHVKSPREDRLKDVSTTDPRHQFFLQGLRSKEATERTNSVGELDVLVLKNALQQANETIRRLHGDLCKMKTVEDGEETDSAPVVDIPDIQPNPTRPESTTSTPDSTHRTVNVQLLDRENFVTDWNDMRDIPPPPDHSLQSPIVSAVLEQWTDDRSLHEALLSWIDNVMKGDDLEKLPPLTISSLDHQVRDGFTMHILPHLLRRADIHVAVQTRTHRRTTYDMSVTVSQKKNFMTEPSQVTSPPIGTLLPKDIKSQQQPSLLDRRDSLSGDEWINRFEPKLSSTESVAHSAVTETIANLPAIPHNPPGVRSDQWDRLPHTPVRTEYSEFSSQLRSRSGSADTLDDSPQLYKQRHDEPSQGVTSGGTIMGALGGALSGLLSRNKYAVSPSRSRQSLYRALGSGPDSRESRNMLPASLRAQMDLTSSPTPGSTGHHRLGQSEATLSGVVDDQYQYHQEEPHPYHRVVSAPPGRIGVTFVEFRGHAMVSDVAIDSPLAGWVFPSDILIAVDEIPVSGMRVRDIVTILSDRKNRQRAMRVISSHAMNEFTMMNQVGSSLNEEVDGGQ